ncbi:MAG: hypothetical protein J5605_04530 [Bacteroidales bacterium]|nr:hypothetical protein [Bacteroidales bacterium]
MTTLTATDKRRFLLLRAISIAQIVVGVAFIVLSYGKLSTPATAVLCTVTFFGVLASWYRKDVAAGILFATSAAWLMQLFDVFTYFVFFQYFRTDILVYAVCMSVLSLTNLFLADYFWAKTNGKAFKPKRLCLIVVVFALLPALSYVYRSHDIDGVYYRIDYLKDRKQKPSIVFTSGEESTPHIAINDREVVIAIISNSDRDLTGWYCYNCRIRVRSCFTNITKIELVKNLSEDIFYDDYAELPISDNGRYNAVAMKIEDLWW